MISELVLGVQNLQCSSISAIPTEYTYSVYYTVTYVPAHNQAISRVHRESMHNYMTAYINSILVYVCIRACFL